MRIIPFIVFLFFAASHIAFAQGEQSDADKRRELFGTTQVSKVHSLDNAKGSYKSPKKALFMSLIIPGSGQFYVGGGQSRYVRGTFYLAEEIALIFGLYYNSMYKYDKQVKKYQDFANEHFSVNRYEIAMNSLYNPIYEESFNKFYKDPERENYCKSFFGNNAYTHCFDNFGQTKGSPNDNTPKYNASAYYRAIVHETLVLGWGDVKQEENLETNLHNSSPSDEPLLLGTSEYRENYLSMRKKASDYADRQAIFLGAIILNHLVSAIDAALSARAHNNNLYEEKISFLNRIKLNSNFQINENPRTGVTLGFNF